VTFSASDDYSVGRMLV